MRHALLFTVILIQSVFICSAQMTMHDFTVKDAEGHTHKLYADYLNQNKTVVIKFFFTTCPPCIANAPSWQQKYVQWGSGTQGVEFFSVTTITSDTDSKVNTFENTYGQTMKGISNEGFAPLITGPFMSGNYGSWYGTPSFAVIAPDKTLFYPVLFGELDATINIAKNQTAVAPTSVNLTLETNNTDIADGHIKFFLSPAGASTPKLEIVKNAQGVYSFVYPSATFPKMANPEITMESFAPAYTSKVSASDVLAIQKHILGFESLSPSYKLIAADVNSDSKITASDILNIKKVILGLVSSFPNNTPSYVSLPDKIAVTENPGNNVNLNFTIIKKGNVN